MDEKLFPNPAAFVPYRWMLGHEKSATPEAKAAHSPFGFGAHHCLGYNLAYLNIKATLHTILTKTDISMKLAEKMELEPSMFPTMKVKNGLRLNVQRC